MQNDQGILICESLLLELDPLTMAAGGAAVGAGLNAARWANRRLQLRREMKNCGSDPQCQGQVRYKIASLNKESLRKGVKGAAVGAALGGIGGAASSTKGAAALKTAWDTTKGAFTAAPGQSASAVGGALNTVGGHSRNAMGILMATQMAAGTAGAVKKAAAEDVQGQQQQILRAQQNLADRQQRAREDIQRAKQTDQSQQSQQKDRIQAQRKNVMMQSGGD